jgi:hypothetical protein
MANSSLSKVAALVLIICISIIPTNLRADTLAGSAWAVDPTLAPQLAPQATIGAIGTIQPPLGYTLQEKDSPDGQGSVYQWTGPAGIKGYSPSYSIVIAVPPKDSDQHYSTDLIMATLVSTFQTGKKNWKLSSVSVGTISGKSFHRVDWSGLDSDKKLNIQGSVLGTQLADGSFLIISAEDAEPDSKTSLPIMTDSSITLQLK